MRDLEILRFNDSLGEIEIAFSLPRNPLDVCNAILSPDLQREIDKASIFASVGEHESAEACRNRAGYGNAIKPA